MPAFLTDAGFYLIVFALGYVLDADGASSRDVALVFGVYSLLYAVAAPALGRASDARGRRLSVLAGSLLFACAAASLAGLIEIRAVGETVEVASGASVGVGAVAYTGIAFLALANALFWPAFQARIGDRNPEPAALARALRFFNVGWTSGKALGFLLAGALFSFAPSLCLLAGAGAGALVFLVLVIFDGRIESAGPEVPAATSSDNKPDAARETKRSFLVAALVSNLVLWGSLATLKALAPKLGESLGVGALETGSLLFLALSAQGVGFFLLGNSTRWTYRVGTLLAAVPAALAGLALVYVAGAESLGPVALGLVAAGAGAVVIGGAQAVTYTASVFYSLDFDQKRGLRTGIHEAVLALGGSLPILGGALADASGNLQAPLLFMGAICVVGALLIGWILRGEFARTGRAS